MGTKTKTVENTVQKNDPPSWAAPGLAELGQRITQIIPTMPGPSYQGSFYAPVSEREAGMAGKIEANADFSRAMAIPAMGAVAQAQTPVSYNPLAQAGFGSYDPTGVQSVIESAMKPAFRRLQEQVLPGLQSSATESGAYGGDRAQTLLPSLAIRDTMGEVGDIASRIAYQDFSDQQARALQGYGLATERGLGEAGTLTQRLSMFPDLMDTVMRMQTGATDMDMQAAQYDNSLRQREIEEALARQDYSVRQPFQGLDVAAALLGNLAQPWGTRTTNGTTTQSAGGAGQFLQAGLGLAQLAGSAFGMPGGGGGGFSSLFANKGRMGPMGNVIGM